MNSRPTATTASERDSLARASGGSGGADAGPPCSSTTASERDSLTRASGGSWGCDAAPPYSKGRVAIMTLTALALVAGRAAAGDSIDAFVSAEMSRQRIPGLSLAVVRHGVL